MHIYLLGLAGRADEAIPIAEAVLRHSSQAHLRSVAPFVRWSAGDASEIDSFRHRGQRPRRTPTPATGSSPQPFATHIHASLGDAVQAPRPRRPARLPCRSTGPTSATPRCSPRPQWCAWLPCTTRRAPDKLLAEHLDRHPISDPRCEIHLRRSLATVYVCAPAVRPALGSRSTRSLPSTHARGGGGAPPGPSDRCSWPAAIRGDRPAISRALDDTDALITILPLPFAVELAAHAHGLGLPAGARALEWLRHRVGDHAIAEMRWQLRPRRRGRTRRRGRSAPHLSRR